MNFYSQRDNFIVITSPRDKQYLSIGQDDRLKSFTASYFRKMLVTRISMMLDAAGY